MTLSHQQLAAFHEQGFCKLTNTIPPDLLNRLHLLFDELMYDQKSENDIALFQHNGKRYVTNLENICCKGNLSCLELLGSPFILALAEQICGPDFFLIQEFAVIKNAGDELPVLWHQDMVHERSGQCFTLGIYLDDVDENDGALRIVPGSHLSAKTICELCNEPFIEIPMKAGEMLLHDMMVAHSSEPMRKNMLRRVIYFEFLSAKQVRDENIYTDELIKNRTNLIPAAIAYFQQLHPETAPFQWKNESAGCYEPVTDIKSLLEIIYATAIHARPSNYCLEPVKDNLKDMSYRL